jgi:biopolymer transport protein ExbD
MWVLESVGYTFHPKNLPLGEGILEVPQGRPCCLDNWIYFIRTNVFQIIKSVTMLAAGLANGYHGREVIKQFIEERGRKVVHDLRQTEVKIELPKAEDSEVEEHPKIITIDIDADATYYLKGEDGLPHELVNQTRETLKQELARLAKQSRQLPFVINTDGKTPSEAVLKVLDIASQAGFNQITFSTLYPATEK